MFGRATAGFALSEAVSARSRAGRRLCWRPSLRLVVVVALSLLAQLAQPITGSDRVGGGADNGRTEQLGPIQLRSGPSPSGAEPPYPLNHTLDGDLTDLGSVTNADFESDPSGSGSPPTNFDLESEPIDVASVTNGDFETGDFTGWTLTGSPTIQSDQTHGYWTRLGSSSQDMTSTAVTIPQSAQALVFDANYQVSGSWLQVYVL